jgi:hypothetical protein
MSKHEAIVFHNVFATHILYLSRRIVNEKQQEMTLVFSGSGHFSKQEVKTAFWPASKAMFPYFYDPKVLFLMHSIHRLLSFLHIPPNSSLLNPLPSSHIYIDGPIQSRSIKAIPYRGVNTVQIHRF